MSAYTKEQFEQYKGDQDKLQVIYILEFTDLPNKEFTCTYSTYEEYLEDFNKWERLR